MKDYRGRIKNINPREMEFRSNFATSFPKQTKSSLAHMKIFAKFALEFASTLSFRGPPNPGHTLSRFRCSEL